jgi:hypothetical protein
LWRWCSATTGCGPNAAAEEGLAADRHSALRRGAADAWRDADPQRQFTVARHALARAYVGTSHPALAQAAHTLLSVLARQPLTHSPAAAATASRLRRLVDPASGPQSPGTTHRATAWNRLIPADQHNWQ